MQDSFHITNIRLTGKLRAWEEAGSTTNQGDGRGTTILELELITIGCYGTPHGGVSTLMKEVVLIAVYYGK